jgi:methionine synthase II (cobalamin-independent)
MGNSLITKAILIEDLVKDIPEAVTYLMKKGVKCIACGEPLWGTLESVAMGKGFSEQEIVLFVKEINELNTNQKIVNE